MTDQRLFAVVSNTTGETILVKERETGFWPAPLIEDPRAFNARKGHTVQEVAAAYVGSMFGWRIPGAMPEIYTADEAESIAYGGPPR
ncbi:hypothetical protein [Mesorhizobium sp.]|uniref:hypothetical protein n=1 Tax=Mesorhizobium sp. TaxID=1871066 RepID=UPI000FE7DDB2|nr:hypothetical protein [Mesorhizobium sp.]RWN60165.1 MAG: hypothetical protein EOS00_16610 [Mesorhizobium sp.]